MPSFLETPRFPDEISAWAIGGRGFKTTIAETYGGDEYRVGAWAQARGEWSLDEALRSTNPNSAYNWQGVRNMHKVCRGMLYGFRFRDHADYKDEGGGVFVAIDATHFQMYKSYSVSPLSYSQKIQKPQPSSGSYAGVVVTGGSGATVDYTTGIVTVASGTPTAWTGQFDIPVRFDGDVPRIGLESTGAFFNWGGLRVVEIRNPG